MTMFVSVSKTAYEKDVELSFLIYDFFTKNMEVVMCYSFELQHNCKLAMWTV